MYVYIYIYLSLSLYLYIYIYIYISTSWMWRAGPPAPRGKTSRCGNVVKVSSKQLHANKAPTIGKS